MPACNLIIDSCCDLPFDVVDREGIELIEFPYIAGDGEHSDDMYRSRSAHDFFDSMRNGDSEPRQPRFQSRCTKTCSPARLNPASRPCA